MSLQHMINNNHAEWSAGKSYDLHSVWSYLVCVVYLAQQSVVALDCGIAYIS